MNDFQAIRFSEILILVFLDLAIATIVKIDLTSLFILPVISWLYKYLASSNEKADGLAAALAS